MLSLTNAVDQGNAPGRRTPVQEGGGQGPENRQVGHNAGSRHTQRKDRQYRQTTRHDEKNQARPARRRAADDMPTDSASVGPCWGAALRWDINGRRPKDSTTLIG